MKIKINAQLNEEFTRKVGEGNKVYATSINININIAKLKTAQKEGKIHYMEINPEEKHPKKIEASAVVTPTTGDYLNVILSDGNGTEVKFSVAKNNTDVIKKMEDEEIKIHI